MTDPSYWNFMELPSSKVHTLILKNSFSITYFEVVYRSFWRFLYNVSYLGIVLVQYLCELYGKLFGKQSGRYKYLQSLWTQYHCEIDCEYLRSLLLSLLKPNIHFFEKKPLLVPTCCHVISPHTPFVQFPLFFSVYSLSCLEVFRGFTFLPAYIFILLSPNCNAKRFCWKNKIVCSGFGHLKCTS